MAEDLKKLVEKGISKGYSLEKIQSDFANAGWGEAYLNTIPVYYNEFKKKSPVGPKAAGVSPSALEDGRSSSGLTQVGVDSDSRRKTLESFITEASAFERGIEKNFTKDGKRIPVSAEYINSNIPKLSNAYKLYQAQNPNAPSFYDEDGKPSREAFDYIRRDYDAQVKADNQKKVEKLKKEANSPLATLVLDGAYMLAGATASFLDMFDKNLSDWWDWTKTGDVTAAIKPKKREPTVLSTFADEAFDNWNNKITGAKLNDGLTVEEIEDGAIGNAQKGNYRKAATLLGWNIAEALPLYASMVLTKKPFTTAFTVGAGSAFQEVKEDDAFNDLEKFVYAMGVGGAELATEKLFPSDIVAGKNAGKEMWNFITRSAGKESVEQLSKRELGDILFGKIPGLGKETIARAGVEEGIEEAIAGGTQQALANWLGDKPYNLRDVGEQALTGLGFGTSIKVATKGTSALLQSANVKDVISIKNRISEISSLLEDETISAEEKSLLSNQLNKFKTNLRQMQNSASDYYKNFSKEDVDQTIKLNQQIDNGLSTVKSLKTPEAKMALIQDIKSALEQKAQIEQKYDSTQKQQVPSPVVQGAQPGGVPIQGTSAEAPQAGGVLQVPSQQEEEIVKKTREVEASTPSASVKPVSTTLNENNYQGIIGSVRQYVDNLSDNLFETLGTSRQQVMNGVDSIANVLSSFAKSNRQIPITIYATEEAWKRGTGEQDVSRGIYVEGKVEGQPTKISIFLPALVGNTVYHEGLHDVVPKVFGVEGINKVSKALSEAILQDATLASSLGNFASNYKKGQRAEEFLVELASRVSSGDIDIEVTKSLATRFMEAIAKVLGVAGIKMNPSSAQLSKALVEYAQRLGAGVALEEKPFDVKGGEKESPFFGKRFQEYVSEIRKRKGLDDAQEVEDEVENMLEGNTEPGPVADTQKIKKPTKYQGIIKTKNSYKLSYVNPTNVVDIESLIDEIVSEGKTVLFWAGDQLGVGQYTDPFTKKKYDLQGGPSYMLNPTNVKRGAVWASNIEPNTFNDILLNKKPDYVFIVSGEETSMMFFNKTVGNIWIDRAKSKFNDISSFKEAFGKVTKGAEYKAIAEYNSWDELRNQLEKKVNTKADTTDVNIAKSLIKAIAGMSKNPKAVDFLKSYGLTIKQFNDLRDGYFKENNFGMLDITTIYKPKELIEGGSDHLTYRNVLMGELVGVPDRKMSSKDIMTDEFMLGTTGKGSVRKDLPDYKLIKAIAPDTPGVRAVARPRKVMRMALEGYNEKPQAMAGQRLFNEPLKEAADIADKYYEKEFNEARPKFNGVKSVDKERAKKISDAYVMMEDNYFDPEVKKAYDAMIDETLKQFDFIVDRGYKVVINNEEPYKNSEDMITDLRDNKVMRIFSTESGFGDEPITENQRDSNPLLKDSGRKDANGVPLLNNDLFRFVHDFFGHAELGNGFGAVGEENAWNVHARMYSPLARRAMTSETRGQNSYVNFSGVNEEAFKLRDKAREERKKGNDAEADKLLGEVYEKMKFADQKVGLLPEEMAIPDGFEDTKPKAKQQEAPTKKAMLQIIGENAELAQDVRDNLRVARNMEMANEDAKTIRMATGWERGKDNKWRYEVKDLEFKKKIGRFEEDLNQVIRSAKNGNVEQYDLEQLIDSNLFDFYPSLKNTSVILSKRVVVGFQNVLGGVDASYYKEGKRGIIAIKAKEDLTIEKLRLILVHEIQHAIQDIEGFAEGNYGVSMQEEIAAEKEINLLDNKIGVSTQILRDGNDSFLSENINELSDIEKAAYEDILDYSKSASMPILDAAKVKDRIWKKDKATQQDILKQNERYVKTAGEVEARNVETRIKLTPEQRRAITLQETEDVARDEQITLFDAKPKAKQQEGPTQKAMLQIIGSNADLKEWTSKMLLKANEMERRGVKPKTIFNVTGWERGADKKWKYPVPTFKLDYTKVAEFNNGPVGSTVNLYDLVENKGRLNKTSGKYFYDIYEYDDKNKTRTKENEDVFDFYPKFANIKVTLGPTDGGTFYKQPSTYPGDKTLGDITISKKWYNKSPDHFFFVLVHEIQHAVQHMEGFAVGGSPSTIENELNDFIKANERILANKDKVIPALKNGIKDQKERIKWYIDQGYSQETIIKDGVLNTLDGLETQVRMINDVEKQLEFLKKIKGATNLSNDEKYELLSGEVEANNAAKRATFELAKGAPTIEMLAETEQFGKEYQLILTPDIEQMSLPSFLTKMGYNPKVKRQVTAWHGSPYDFEAFKSDKIGTGEGAQAFGWGLYFTDLESIAKEYASHLSNYISANNLLHEFFKKEFGVSDKVRVSEYQDGDLSSNGYELIFIDTNYFNNEEVSEAFFNNKGYDKYLKQIKRELEVVGDVSSIKYNKDYDQITVRIKQKQNKYIYGVSLHKGKTPDQYTWLEWDRGVDRKIENKAQELFEKEYPNKTDYYGRPIDLRNQYYKDSRGKILEFEDSAKGGEKLYRSLAMILGSAKEASLFLLRAGIDGIKYPAESRSRGTTSDTARGFNYVVFDENAVTIDKKIKLQKIAKAQGSQLEAQMYGYLLSISQKQPDNTYKLPFTLNDFLSFMSPTFSRQRATQIYQNVSNGVIPQNVVKSVPSIDDAYDASKKLLDSQKNKKIFTWDAARKFFLDRQATLKAAILKAGMKNAYNLLVNRAGSGARANYFFSKQEKAIYDGLSSKDIEALDKIIMLRRIAEIDKNFDVRGEKRPIHPNKLNFESAQIGLAEKRKELGDAKFNELNDRANKYFDAFKSLLDSMYDEGLINEDLYNRLKNLDYQPRMFIEHVFDMDELSMRDINLSANQVKRIKDGSEDEIMFDSRFLLAVYSKSTFSRIARNKVNRAIAEATSVNGNEEWISKDPKKQFSEVTYFEDGVRKQFYIKSSLKGELDDVQRFGAIPPESQKYVGLLSGSYLLKLLATRANPLFVFRNIPRDYLHVLFFTNVYDNMNMPLAMYRLAGDAIKGVKGKIKDDQDYKDFIEYGGGMEYLSTEGKEGMMTNRSLLNRTIEKLGSAGELSEIAFRLGMYKRLVQESLKNFDGTPTEEQLAQIKVEAVTKSREMIDFAQGGVATKTLESAVPYINAAFQGFRVSSAYIKNNPKEFVIKLGQLAIGLAVIAMYNAVMGDDDMEDIPEDVKRKYFIIMTPFTEEKDGKTVRKYIKIAKTQQLIPFISSLDMSLEGNLIAPFMGREPRFNEDTIKQSWDAFLSYFPKDPTKPLDEALSSVPLFSALAAYKMNYDTYRKRIVSTDYQDKNVLPAYEDFSDKNVPYFYKAIGQAVVGGAGPKRLQVATEKFITTPYSSLITMGGYTLMDAIASNVYEVKGPGGYTPAEQEAISNKALKSAGINVEKIFIGTTDPDHKIYNKREQIERINLEASTERRGLKLQAKELGGKYFTAREQGDTKGMNEALEAIRKARIEVRDKAVKDKNKQDYDYFNDALKTNMRFGPTFPQEYNDITFATDNEARAKIIAIRDMNMTQKELIDYLVNYKRKTGKSIDIRTIIREYDKFVTNEKK